MPSFVLVLLFVVCPLSFASDPSVHYQPGYARECTDALVASNGQLKDEFKSWGALKDVLFVHRNEFETALVLKVNLETLSARPTNFEELFGLLVAPGLLRLPEFNSLHQGEAISVVYGPTSSWLKFSRGLPEISDATLVRAIDLNDAQDPLAQKVAVAVHVQRRNTPDREQNLARIQKILVQFNDGRRLSEPNGLKHAVLAIAERIAKPERVAELKELIESKTSIGPDDGLRFTFSPAALVELRRALVIFGQELSMNSDSVSNLAFEAKVLDRAATRSFGEIK